MKQLIRQYETGRGNDFNSSQRCSKSGNGLRDQAEDCVDLMAHLIEAASESLDNTPNLLAVLKEVGVVDSGGKGLLCVYEGFLKGLKGEK